LLVCIDDRHAKRERSRQGPGGAEVVTGEMPPTMSGSPSPPKPTKADLQFGGDRSKKSVYKGPSKKWDPTMKGGPMADVGSGGGWSGTKATQAGDLVQDKRTKFEKKFDDEQAKWQDNFDRNDDALYHRSFDDGSMHLKSTKFRDGKPKDNHGKEIGGMGAKAITKYRRHDLQRATSEGESA
jgi:hypothetical protein